MSPSPSAGRSPLRSSPRQVFRAAVGTFAVLALWAGLAVTSPEVTYHLAPALVVWVTPWMYGAPRRRGLLAATVAGLLVAVGAASLLRAGGWLAGPVLFGGDALGEALIVSLGAAAIAAGVITGISRGER